MTNWNQGSVLLPPDAEDPAAKKVPQKSDEGADARLQGVSWLAARMFGVQTVVVALADGQQVRFISSTGTPLTSARRQGSFTDAVMRNDGPLVVEDARADPRFAHNPAVIGEPYTRFGAGQALRAPGGQPIGALSLFDPTPRVLDDTERHLLTELALWLEDAIALRRELERAGEVQRRLLPKRLLSLHGFDVAGGCVQARTVGGDFYDWYPIGEGAAFTLADVMGKGIGASIIAATVRAVLRAGSRRGSVVSAVESAAAILEEDLDQTGSFVTLFHARLDMHTGVVRYIDAGHGLSLVVRADGSTKRLATTSFPLGTGLESGWREHTVELGYGDTLVALSDGVLDLFDGTLAALNEVERITRDAANADATVSALLALAGDNAPDDVTVFAIRRIDRRSVPRD